MTDKINIHDPTSWVSPPGFGLDSLVTPELSGWTAHLGSRQHTPLAGQEPNAFHRLMQRLVLGIRWERTASIPVHHDSGPTSPTMGGIDRSPSPYWRNHETSDAFSHAAAAMQAKPEDYVRVKDWRNAGQDER